MTADELVLRFPEIPADLRQEPLLAEFAKAFDDLLRVAIKPSACAQEHSEENHYYLKLLGPMDIYRYGLFTRERVLSQIDTHLAEYRKDPDGFAASLTAGQEKP